MVCRSIIFQKQIHSKPAQICGYQWRGWREREVDVGGQKMQTSSYKRNTWNEIYNRIKLINTAECYI